MSDKTLKEINAEANVLTDYNNVFAVLNAINVNDKKEEKNGLSYLSWAWAWGEAKKIYPDATYTIYENAAGWCYHTDNLTCWVKTGVTINGLEHIEYLPVMDYKNKSIPADKVTSFDVNKAIQRSLTKALARHGLGLYIYAGEDLPEVDKGKEIAKRQEEQMLRWSEYRTKLSDLKVDFREDEDTVNYILKTANVKSQDLDKISVEEAERLLNVYLGIIKNKEKSKEVKQENKKPEVNPEQAETNKQDNIKACMAYRDELKKVGIDYLSSKVVEWCKKNTRTGITTMDLTKLNNEQIIDMINLYARLHAEKKAKDHEKQAK